ncbi:MAG TPA: hypothetical protein DCQ94_00890 [Nitrospira sp.]|nr:hypothetical protein [Nitrospira sp.]
MHPYELNTNDPLSERLQPYLSTHPVLGAVLRHPLVYSVPYHPMMAGLLNAQLAQKELRLSEAVSCGDWSLTILLHERPWRAQAIAQYASAMDDASYWRVVAWAYTDSENVNENFELWGEILNADRPARDLMMTSAEREVLAGLPEQIKVFRGDVRKVATDYSWTIERDVAVWFAKRTARLEKRSRSLVLEGLVAKQHVIAYKASRNESELIVAPHHVAISQTCAVA